jgi:hypothetical protein
MSDIVIPYKILEIDLFNNVETALKNINSTANVGIHLIRIKAAVERAIFDEEKDTAFEQTGPWSEELRKLNNFLKRLKDKPPTHNRIKKRIEELHEVTKYFLNARLKISGTSGKGLSELNLGSIEDLEELKMAVSHTRKIHHEKPGGGNHNSIYDVVRCVQWSYSKLSGKKPTLTSQDSAVRFPKDMNAYEELLLETIKIITPHATANSARELERATRGSRKKKPRSQSS